MSIQTPNRIHALGVFEGWNANILNARGFTSIVRNGAGDYTLTLEQGLDPLSRIAFVQTRGGEGYASVVDVTDEQVQVLLIDYIGAPTDFDFECGVIAFNLEQ